MTDRLAMPQCASGAPLTVVLCGSITRADDAINGAAREAWKSGCWVYAPTANPSLTADELADCHRQMIDAADLVIVCIGSDGRIGQATTEEWDYALRQGKPVREYYAPAADPTGGFRISELQRLLRYLGARLEISVVAEGNPDQNGEANG